MNLLDVVKQFILSLKAKGVSAAHLHRTDHALKRLTSAFPGRSIESISKEELIEWSHKLKRADGRAYADASKAGIHRAVKSLWKYAKDKGLVRGKSPAKKLPSHNYTSPRDKSIPTERVGRLLASLPALVARHKGEREADYRRDVRDALIVSLILDSSVRRGEIPEIERLEAERALKYPTEVKYKAAGVARRGMVYTIQSRGKTGEVILVITESTAVLLREWLTLIPPKTTYLFTSERTGRPIDPRSVNRAFEKACAFADIPTYHPHSIRHRNITDLAQLMDTKTASKVAGHKDEGVTLRHYVHTDRRQVNAAALVLAELRQTEQEESLADEFFASADGHMSN
jgi:integrase